MISFANVNSGSQFVKLTSSQIVEGVEFKFSIQGLFRGILGLQISR